MGRGSRGEGWGGVHRGCQKSSKKESTFFLPIDLWVNLGFLGCYQQHAHNVLGQWARGKGESHQSDLTDRQVWVAGHRGHQDTPT